MTCFFRMPIAAAMFALLAPLVLLAADAPAVSSNLATVKSKGTLSCGVVREEEDYSKADVHGNRAAFDIDICKALSTAILGTNAKTEFRTFYDEPTAITALRSGKVAVIATATPNLTNTAALGVSFSPVILFDGQGFLVRKNSGITNPRDLAGKKVCFIAETSNADNLPAYAARENINLFPFPFEEEGEMEAAMYTANCAAMTSDITQLANTRARFNVRAREFDILPQLIAKDPLAVAYMPGDRSWAAVIDATVSALLVAEERGVTAANVEAKRSESADLTLQAFFAKNSGLATRLQLDPDWAVRVIKSVGNYGEMYERDLGTKSPLQLPRGLSNLWNRGGLLYAPPLGPG